MKRLTVIFTVFILCGVCGTTLAQETCPSITEQALVAVDHACEEMGADQICFGNVDLEMEPASNAVEYTFEEPGDVMPVRQVQRLQLYPMDVDAGVWGVAMMRLRANIPDTLPGQAVTFLMFGNVEMENRDPGANLTTVDITVTGNMNVRSGPGTNFAVAASLSNGQSVVADGRNEAGDWLKIRLEDSGVGWVYTPLVTVDGDLVTLAVVEFNESDTGPQAYYFRTGVGDAPCAEAPSSGILLRSPEGIAEINLTLNDVNISLGSTLFLQAEPAGTMNVSVLEGHARVSAFGDEQLALSGTTVSVPINAQLEATGPPNPPQPCVASDLRGIPVEEWQCEWVEVHFGDYFQECPAIAPAGMDILFSVPLMERPYTEAQIDAFIADATSSITIDGQAVAVTRSSYGEGDDWGYDTHYYWSSPATGTYTVVGSNQDQTFTCQLTVLAP